MDESVVKFLEQPQVGTLKLSAAIRIGASRTAWAQNGYYCSKQGATCVYGAAAVGMGAVTHEDIHAMASRLHTGGPATMAFIREFGNDIAEVNDRGTMTREQIADWLEAQGY